MKSKSKVRSPYRSCEEDRLKIVAELLSKGLTYRKIAREVSRRLGIPSYSKTTASRDARYLFDKWKEERLILTEKAVSLLLERNQQHYRETREECDRSREDQTLRSSESKLSPGDKPSIVEAKQKSKSKPGKGDPRYMDLLIRLEDQRARLLGLYRESPLIKPSIEAEQMNRLTTSDKEELLEIARKYL